MGLFPTDCTNCGEPFLWQSSNHPQWCETCREGCANNVPTHTCERCGSPVKVVDETMLRYEPAPVVSDMDARDHMIYELTAQLAAMTSERDEWKEKATRRKHQHFAAMSELAKLKEGK